MLLKEGLRTHTQGGLCTCCQDFSVSALISLRGEPILCLLQHLWISSVVECTLSPSIFGCEQRNLVSGTEEDFLLGYLRVSRALLAHWGQGLRGGGATDSPPTVPEAQTHTC